VSDVRERLGITTFFQMNHTASGGFSPIAVQVVLMSGVVSIHACLFEAKK